MMASCRSWKRTSGVSVALLTGRDKGKQRNQILAGLADGTIQIAMGTHALFGQQCDAPPRRVAERGNGRMVLAGEDFGRRHHGRLALVFNRDQHR